MSDNWVSVYTTGVKHLAEWAKEMLEDNGIIAVVLNKKDSIYLFGEIEVYVKPEDEGKAKELIENFQKTFKLE